VDTIIFKNSYRLLKPESICRFVAVIQGLKEKVCEGVILGSHRVPWRFPSSENLPIAGINDSTNSGRGGRFESPSARPVRPSA